MATYSVLVEVQLKPGISDPQGATVERSMKSLGYSGVSSVKIGKAMRMEVDAANEVAARKQVHELCEHLLTNPVLETATISIESSLVDA